MVGNKVASFFFGNLNTCYHKHFFRTSEPVIDSDHVVEEGDPIGSSGVEGHQASDHPLAGQNERGHVHGEGGVQIFNKKTNHTPICLEDTFFKKEMN